jgi:hypothetical protein
MLSVIEIAALTLIQSALILLAVWVIWEERPQSDK